MFRVVWSFVYLICFTVCMPVNADIIAYCSTHKGFSSYLRSNPQIDTHNFLKDGVSDFELILKKNYRADKTIYTIWYIRDGIRKMLDHPTYLLTYNPENETYLIFVDASEENYVETYLFRLDGENTRGEGTNIGEVVWTQVRNGSTPKASVFSSPCLYKN